MYLLSHWIYIKECLDKRDVNDTYGMFTAIVEHIKYSFNGGKIQPAITVFRKRQKGKQDMKIWNPLMCHFAGYEVTATRNDKYLLPEDESLVQKIGDQANLEFTRVYE